MFMTQASHNAHEHDSHHSLGAAAAAAVTGSTPVEAAASTTTSAAAPAPAGNSAAPVEDAAAGATEGTGKKARNTKKIYVVIGEIVEFETVAKVEKYLNSEGAPAEFTLLRGQRIKPRQKVSLR